MSVAKSQMLQYEVGKLSLCSVAHIKYNKNVNDSLIVIACCHKETVNPVIEFVFTDYYT